MSGKVQKKQLLLQEGEDYDIDAVLDEPAVSNFLSGDHETVSPRELTFRKDELGATDEPGYSFTTVAAFILACCIAHFVLTTQGFLGARGMERLDTFATKVEEFFTKHSIHVPEGVDLL